MTTTPGSVSACGGVCLAEVTRRDVRSGAELVESRHAGHLVVCAPGGRIVAAVGDADRVTYPRSAVKPFQALACLQVLADHGGTGSELALRELAVAWSSHRGEPDHLAAVTGLLARSATPAVALTCPPAAAEADPGAVPTRLQHDCSGKHALFALAGSALGVDGAALLDPDGPLQQRVLAVLAEVLGPPAGIGTDGCGAPAVAVPLRAVAVGFQQLLTDPRAARLRQAGAAYPLLVGGQGRLESALNAAGVVAKVGAEGVYAATWADADGRPWSLAIKAEDGAARGVAAVVAVLLASLGVIAADTWQPPPPLGGGVPGGVVRPTGAMAGVVAEVQAALVAAGGGWSSASG